MTTPPTILVVNADDFGLCAGINQGIAQAYERGILRSTSLMACGQAFDDAVARCAAMPELGVGIHLTLVGERAVAPRAQLGRLVTPDGMLPASYTAFATAWLQRRFGLAELREEMTAQVERARQTGLAFTHLDSHQHLHLFPGVLEIVLDLANAAGIRVVRLPWEQRPFPLGLPLMRKIHCTALAQCCRRATPRIRQAGLRHPDHFRGLFTSGALDEPALTDALRSLLPGVNEVMCHPGLGDADARARYAWGYRWDDEAAALQSPAIRHLLDDQGIRLANFATAWSHLEGETMARPA